MQMTRRYITIAEAAEYLQISGHTVRRLIEDGELTGYRMGKSCRLIRVDLNEIDEQLMRPINDRDEPRDGERSEPPARLNQRDGPLRPVRALR
ncbi:excisionase family DNA-binding protein [Mycobacterium sp. E3198]|uniref:excisionase family DNA-binding protein n=1 Tax=Mycobacterium sp. E3198 TaxID=1834143 RepID=UPI0007FBAA76|nr:hypothetical protein A5673_15575 [Mycobacterium sp. E3198]